MGLPLQTKHNQQEFLQHEKMRLVLVLVLLLQLVASASGEFNWKIILIVDKKPKVTTHKICASNLVQRLLKNPSNFKITRSNIM